MKRARRAIILGGLIVLGGALVSVLIAEGIGYSGVATINYNSPGRWVAVPAGPFLFCAWKGRGWESVLLQMKSPSTPNPHYESPEALPRWARFWYPENWLQGSTFERYFEYEEVQEVAVGWPFLALSMDGGMSRPHQYQGGMMLSRLQPWRKSVLVWRPIPVGFALDTLIWSACIAVIAGVVRLWARARRRRRGLCAGCGYELRGLADGPRCPECGLLAGVSPLQT